MPDIYVQHVIFTRVERMYSPRRTSGYQIVYQSPSLGSETLLIEKRLQCFQPNSHHIDRYQFFWTESEQAVLARSIPLFSPDPEIIDREQRNAFLAHALVLSKKAFALVRNDPFAIFGAAERNNFFVGDEKQLVAFLNQASPREHFSVLIREKQTRGFFTNWPTSELRKLYELGLQAPIMLQQKQSLLLLNRDLYEIYALLSALLLLLLPHERAVCTFDTFVEGCLPYPGTFWTVGNSRQIGKAGFLPIQIAERSVNIKEYRESSSAPGVKVYSSWLLYMLQNCTELEEINEEVFSAQIIAEAFIEKKTLPAKTLDERALKHFYQANAQFIHQILLQVVSDAFTAHSTYMIESARVMHLVEEVTDVLRDSLSQQEVLSIAAQATYNEVNLAGVIYYWQLNESTPCEYWSELHKFASQAAYAPLLLMTSLKTHSKRSFPGYEEKLREKAVQHLIKKNVLVTVVNELLNIHKRPRALLPRQQNSSAAHMKGFELTDDEFLVLVSTLIGNDAGHVLDDSFVHRVTLVRNKKALRELAKTVKRASGVPSIFIKSLEH